MFSLLELTGAAAAFAELLRATGTLTRTAVSPLR
jgi:hypothetical protein